MKPESVLPKKLVLFYPNQDAYKSSLKAVLED